MRSRKFISILVAIAAAAIVAMPLAGCSVSSDTYYTVTFDSNGGSLVDAQSVKSGKKAKRPTAPTRENCTFKDWYKDTDFEVIWNFKKDKVTSDVTLYAAWNNLDGTPAENDFQTPVDDDKDDDEKPDDEKPDDDDDREPADGKVTATFNVGRDARLAGLSNPVPQTVDSGSTVKQPSVTRSGYSVKWKKEGKTTWNFASDKLTNDTTFFAEWTKDGSGGGTTTPAPSYTPASSLQAANTVYIHYYRPDGNYSNWCVYAWNTNAREYTDCVKDDSGNVYSVSLSSLGLSASDSSVFKFLIKKVGTWDKDGETDNEIRLSSMQKVGNSYHWYVTSGNVYNGSNKFNPGTAITPGKTEPLRESRSDVNRATAAALSPASTVTGWDETGVGYQIFVASFCDSNGDGWGDIPGITSKLDYLHDDLNVDVLWLTPVQKSNSNHGYDCYDYYSINSKFGTDADYRKLVYEVHKRGMKIIMDLVVNHTSPQNEWFIKSKQGAVETVTYQDGTTATVKYRDFYRWKKSGSGGRWYSTGDGYSFYSSFGDNMPELNYDCQAVRNAMADVALYWMAYGLDGFRMDAIKHLFMWDESDNASGDKQSGEKNEYGDYRVNETKDVEAFKEFNSKLKKNYPNCFLLGEQLNGNPAEVAPFYAGMDSLFDFNTYYDLPDRISGSMSGASGQATAFNNNAKLYQQYRGSGNRPINSMITSNHDIARLSYELTNSEHIKLYMSVIMTMPGVSWIYYGDEIGLKEEGGRSYDKAYRQSMKWDSSYSQKCTVIGYGGANNSVKSVAEQKNDNSSILKHVMKVTKLRNDYPALISGTATCSTENGMLKIVCSKKGEKTVTVYHNFSSGSKTVSASGTQVFGGSSIGAYGTAAFAS